MSTRASSQASTNAPSVTASDFPAPPSAATPRPPPTKGDFQPQKDPSSTSEHVGEPILHFDLLFARLQSEFTHLSDEQARINTANELLSQREAAVKAAEENVLSLEQKADKKLERSEQERRITAVQYEAAVEMERINEKKQRELKTLADQLRRQETELGWREEEIERMEKEIQHSAREKDGGKLVFIGPTSLDMGEGGGASNTSSTSAEPPVVPKKNREVSIVGPPRGRTLSMSAFAQHTPPPGIAATFRPGGIFIPDNLSPFEGGRVVPRRISTDNLSSAAPTPMQTRPSASEIALLSPVSPVASVAQADVWEKAARKVASIGKRGVGEEGEGDKLPRGKSVRRVSRHGNLSSLRKSST